MLVSLRCYSSKALSLTSNNLLSLIYHSHGSIYFTHAKAVSVNKFSVIRSSHMCYSSEALSDPATLGIHENWTISKRPTKKSRQETPEGVLKHKLDMCSKHNDLSTAICIYDDARINGIQLTQHHYNVLLYLCSSVSARDSDECDLGLKRGFDIFTQMGLDRVSLNEATFTSMARLSARMEDPGMAFNLVKQMKSLHIMPRLRSYEPALFGFCKKGEAHEAYEVDSHMIESGVSIDENGLSALLKVSSDAKKADKVYEILHRLRSTVRQVSESTAKIVEDWFCSGTAMEIGENNENSEKVRKGILKGGGGWHGQGWLGSGNWNVVRTNIDEKGVCCSCGERLVCIDIDPIETGNFAKSLIKLASQREVKSNFKEFQAWLQRHGPFDAIVDGANVGIIGQREFNFSQLNSIVHKLSKMSPSKRLPLIVLHVSRVYGGPAKNPRNQNLLDTWRKSGALYATPAGSNDDWYWLYAAVSHNCLLVTNDEMRDHLFQLLGTNFFPRWKEKHQVRLSFSTNGSTLHMPPPYSIVTQESETGSWHVPTVVGDDLKSPREWVCATRVKT